VSRTFLTKAADTKYVKDNAALFSSDDPNTPMKRAFLAHTLMREDHDEQRTERMAMMPALMPKTIESVWALLYTKLAATYLDRLPRGGRSLSGSRRTACRADSGACDGRSGRER
jgi:cytochrome P450